jgi:hypothetical protein
MESDCEDNITPSILADTSQANNEIMTMLDAISNQMMSNLQSLQDQLIHTDEKLTQQLQWVVQNHESFKQEINAKFLVLGNSSNMHLPSTPSPDVNDNSSVIPLIVTSGTLLQNSSLISNSTSQLDFQVQMMVMLNNTFSKLSTALVENKSQESNFWATQRNFTPGILPLWLRSCSHLGLNCMILWQTLLYPLLRIQF